MKKIYWQPTTISIKVELERMITASEHRSVSGGPTTVEQTKIPTGVIETADRSLDDIFGNHGQGTGGAGTRSKDGIFGWED